MNKKKNSVSSILVAAIAILISSFSYSHCTTPQQSSNSSQQAQTEKASKKTKSKSADKAPTIAPTSHEGIEIPVSPDGMPEVIIPHTGFTVSFNEKTLCPNWVAWELTKAETDGEANRKDCSFIEDESIPRQYRVTSYDYKNSGYDRGHMCPAADMKWSQKAMQDCHYMTNICPQTPDLNQKWWERLESSCRRWARKEGTIYIVCGPIFNKRNRETIGIDHRIIVPKAFFKVVLSLKKGKEKAIGFYYTNDVEQQNMENAVRSIDDIEKLTGIDFFPTLADDMENKLESMTNLLDWD